MTRKYAVSSVYTFLISGSCVREARKRVIIQKKAFNAKLLILLTK